MRSHDGTVALFGLGRCRGDGIRDTVDSCHTAAGTLATGCPAPAPAKPQAVLKGEEVLLDTVLTKTKRLVAVGV